MKIEFLYKCPECGNKNNSEHWNKSTQLCCIQTITPIQTLLENEYGSVYVKTKFKCPSCSAIVDGDHISIEKLPLILVIEHDISYVKLRDMSLCDFIIQLDYKNGIYKVWKDRYNSNHSKGYIETGEEILE
jgi:DNA-directed RNA polymerase subunit RPC12/RpoP